MRVLFDLGHPGHFHMLKNCIRILDNKGAKVTIAVRERENMIQKLLREGGFSYYCLLPNTPNLGKKAITLLRNDYRLLRISKKLKISLFVSMASVCAAHASAITGKPHITFADTEDAKFVLFLAVPFTDVVITEDSYLGKLPQKKHISLHTWRPLAYLHPRYFKPSSEILDKLNLSKDDKFFIMRFSAWDASHDWRIKRDIGWEDRYKIVKTLEEEGEVLISSELPLPKHLKKYEIKINPIYFHDLLAFSSGYIGEGHITAREAIALGKPAILVSPRGRLEGYNIALERRGFLKIVESYHQVTPKLLEFVTQNNNFHEKVDREIKNFVDLTEFFVWFIENYPYSLEQYRREKNKIVERFRFG